MIMRWRRLATSAVRSTAGRIRGSLHRLREDRWPLSSRGLRDGLAMVRDVEGRLDREQLVQLYDAARALRGDCVEVGPCDAQATCLIGELVAPYQLYVVWPAEVGEPSHPLAERFVRWHRHVLRKQVVPRVVPVLRSGDELVPALPPRIELLVTHAPHGEIVAARRIDLGDEA